MGLIAARLLADAATATDDPGDAAALHRYAHRFLGTYGGLQAAFNDYPERPDAHALAAFNANLSRIRGF